MFTAKAPVDPTAIEKAIDQVLTEMETVTADSPEFAKMTEQLVVLYKALPEKKESGVRIETLVPVIGNLAGIVLILGFEKFNVITSKALGFVMKSKV